MAATHAWCRQPDAILTAVEIICEAAGNPLARERVRLESRLAVTADLQGEDYDREMAQWLEESGRRRGVRPAEPPAELLAYLEQLAGRKLRSREDIRAYFLSLRTEEAERRHADERRRVRREAVFLVVLVAAAMQYYYWDVSLQIASLQKTHYFVPAPSGNQRS